MNHPRHPFIGVKMLRDQWLESISSLPGLDGVNVGADSSAKYADPKGIAGLGIRSWVCSVCGASHDRDVNSALNIRKIGLSAQPRIDESRSSCDGKLTGEARI